mgnify:CR=1 FL=1
MLTRGLAFFMFKYFTDHQHSDPLWQVVLASGVEASPAGSAPIGLTPVDPGKEFVPV